MVITASEARSQLFPLIEKVNTDSTPIIITSKKGNAVLVSESEWESLIETLYLLRTPSNREHLARSQADVQAGRLYVYELPIKKTSVGKRSPREIKKAASAKNAPQAKKKVAVVKAVKALKGAKKKILA